MKYFVAGEYTPLHLFQSDEMAPGSVELMDVEINRTMNESYKRAQTILKTYRSNTFIKLP